MAPGVFCAVNFLGKREILSQKILLNFRNFILLIFSLVFYAWGEGQYIILLSISILVNYLFGIFIAKSGSDFSKNLNISLAVIINLVLLAYFKYANFALDVINDIFGSNIIYHKVHLPIGISFFTFHAISYLVDIYRKKCAAQKNIFTLALYISFFPQLVAGPIVRYNFVEKYLTKRVHNPFFISYGIRRFIIGLGKKIIIANPLGEVADVIFTSNISEISWSMAWIGIICYTLQIYFDFSGYSDMAVGLARIFGFRFPENFNYPYISRSIKEFWRRWHISLSSWFRDYLYIPLGGNRVGLKRQYFNLVLVFFLCGLWHGASMNFVIWGLFHGFFLVLERIYPFLNKMPKLGRNFYVLLVVMIGWVFFRSSDLSFALEYLNIMFFGSNYNLLSPDLLRLLQSHFLWMSFAFALLGFSPMVKNFSLKLIRQNSKITAIFDVGLILVLILAIIRISSATHNPFIYFQF